jgi:hypothetical protein
MTGKALLEGLMQCEIHRCPMIRIEDVYACVVEYADDALGMQGITEVVPGTETEPTVLEFDNGRSLPLLCVCCGEPLQIEDVDLFREVVIGMHLVAIGYMSPEQGQPDGLELILAPADMLDDLPQEIVEPLREGFQALQVHLDSVRRMG